MMDKVPFRGFGGGRSQVEGGGASKIRSSERITPDEASQYWMKERGSRA